MERVLDVYAARARATRSRWSAWTRRPSSCWPSCTRRSRRPRGGAAKEDYHYERAGCEAIFLFFDPHRGWRRVSCRDSRTRVDWAEEVRRLLDEDYPAGPEGQAGVRQPEHALRSRRCTRRSPPAEAHRLARRLEIIHTPRNGSWLNVAEIELSVLARQCLDRRIGSAGELASRMRGVGGAAQRRRR